MKKVVCGLCLILILMLTVDKTQAKVFTRCGLARELLNKGFSRTLVGNCGGFPDSIDLHQSQNINLQRNGNYAGVCLIESESGKDTSKIVNKANGSKALGLFQVNNKDWCKFGSKGGKCNMKCEDLINEDISDDSVCARRVEKELGFRAWEGWMRSCYGRTLPLPNC